MVGAGIFALLGAAGEVAGAAVWLSFLIAGVRRRAAGLLVRQVRRPLPVGRRAARVRRPRLRQRARDRRHRLAAPGRQRDHHRHGGGVVRQLRQRGLRRRRRDWTEGLRRAGRARDGHAQRPRARRRWREAQTVVVVVVIGILTVFAVATLANLDLDLLAFSGYPSFGDIVSSVALDLLRLPRVRRHHVHRQGPRATPRASCPGRSTSPSASRPSSTSRSHWACSAR